MGEPVVPYTPAASWSDDPALFDGVVWRRVLAYAIDLMVVGLLIGGYYFLVVVAGIMTFGLAFPALAALGSLIPIAYHTLTLGGPNSATLGMRVFGLQMRVWHGGAPSYLQAFLCSAAFYVSVYFTAGLILLVALFNNRRRCLHDILCGTVVLRRPSAGA